MTSSQPVPGGIDPGPAATRPAAIAAADESGELPDDVGLSIVGDESFESAAPAPEREKPPENQTATVPVPTVAAIAEKVPPATRALLAELFKAEITSVRRISRDQLR